MKFIASAYAQVSGQVNRLTGDWATYYQPG